VAGDRGDEVGRRGISPKAVGALLVLAVLVWFALANRTRVEVDFLVRTYKVRLVYALAVAALLGALVGWLAGRSRARRE